MNKLRNNITKQKYKKKSNKMLASHFIIIGCVCCLIQNKYYKYAFYLNNTYLHDIHYIYYLLIFIFVMYSAVSTSFIKKKHSFVF